MPSSGAGSSFDDVLISLFSGSLTQQVLCGIGARSRLIDVSDVFRRYLGSKLSPYGFPHRRRPETFRTAMAQPLTPQIGVGDSLLLTVDTAHMSNLSRKIRHLLLGAAPA
jgi:hypothetical protein